MKAKAPTIDDIKTNTRKSVNDQIRAKYSIDDEFRLVNLGITKGKNNKDYADYRKEIDEIILHYQKQTGEIYER